MSGTQFSRTGRVRFRGWYKGLPFLLIPFAVIFTEVHLRTQQLYNDYAVSTLNEAVTHLKKDIADLEAERASLENVKLMEARAAQMQFVKPQPNQVEVIHARSAPAGADGLTLEPLSLP